MGNTESAKEYPLSCVVKTLSPADRRAYSEENEGYTVVFMRSGNATVSVNGKETSLAEREMLFLTPAVCSHFVSVSGNAEAVFLRFSSAFAGAAVKGSLPVLFRGDKDGIYSAAFTRENGIGTLLEKTLGERNVPELAAGAAALSLLLCAVKNGLASDPGSLVPRTIKEKMPEILAMVGAQLPDCDEKAAAESLGVSYSYFSRSFKAEMGMSFREYVNFRRVNEAKRRLVSSDADIASIADTLGFSSPSHFINVFGSLTGMSPKQFRKKYTEKAQ